KLYDLLFFIFLYITRDFVIPLPQRGGRHMPDGVFILYYFFLEKKVIKVRDSGVCGARASEMGYCVP
ncbi:hypothetical protein, partial [Ornithobacterium rhinotracheale]